MPTDGPSRIRRVLRVAWRVSWITVLVVVGLLVLVVGLVALPAVRDAGLERGLAALEEALPGSFGAEARWPSPGRVELRDVVWRVEDRSVLTVDRADLEVGLSALFTRDAVVRSLRVESVQADVDAIGRALAATADTSTAPAAVDTATGPPEIPWLRSGAIEGLPSFAIQDVVVRDVHATAGGTDITLHEFLLGIDARAGRTDLGRIDLDVGTSEYGRLRGGMGLAADDSLRVHFDVFDWTPPGGEPSDRDPAGGVRWALPPDLVPRAAAGELDVVPFSVHGTLVRQRPASLDLALRWSPDGTLDVAFELMTPRPPVWARAQLADSDSLVVATFDRWIETWPDGPDAYRVHGTGEATLDSSGFTPRRAFVDARLPGPGDLVPELEVSRGAATRLVLDARPGPGAGIRAEVDLEVPEWLSLRAPSMVWDGAGGLAADSLVVRGPGLELDGRAEFDGGRVDGDVALRVVVAQLVEAARPWLTDGPWEDLPERLALDARVQGELPPSDAGLRGSIDLEIPDWLTLQASSLTWDGAEAVTADSLIVRGSGIRLDGRGRLDAGRVDGTVALRVAVAELVERVRPWIGEGPWDDLPFHLAVDLRTDGELPRPGADLEASLATTDGERLLSLTAVHRPDSLRAVASVDVEALRPLVPDSLRGPLETSTVQRIRVGVRGAYDVEGRAADARVGLRVRGEEGALQFAADVGGSAAGTARARIDTLVGTWRDVTVESAQVIRIDADGEAARLALEDLDLRGSFGRIQGDATADSNGAQGRVIVDVALPRARLLEWVPGLETSLPPADSVKVRLTADLGGTSLAPVIDVEARAGLVSERAGDLVATARLAYEDVATLDAGLLVGGEEWVGVEGRVPLDLGLAPFAASLRTEDEFGLVVETPRLDLKRLAERVDAPFDVAGDLTVSLRARGPLGTMDLGGTIRSDRARIELPDGSWVETRTSVALEGDIQAPRVDGAVRIQRGLILLPEVPRSRLPTSGDALLREAIAARDTSETKDSAVSSALDTFTVPLPDVTMALEVPGGLRVRGHGLDVELEGRIEAVVEEGVPGLGGSLAVTRGRLDLLGRRFEVETGEVVFDPDEVEPDPALDIRLATNLEGRRYTVAVTGTATEPRLTLGSEPEMPEGDIVSALLFGRPLDELDEGQSELLAQRTQEIAAAYGAAMLSQRIGKRLGVDILSIEPGREGEAASLVVGQYLSPDVVIQYEQVLEEGAAALVRLEYSLTRSLRVETTASQGDHSGVELRWKRDY